MEKVPVRQIIITGNWKMYKTVDEATQFVQDLIPQLTESQIKIYLAVPFTAIYPTCEIAKNSQITIGAQNMNEADEGAFTGEIAGRMLKNAGAQFVILGHSERRTYFNETNQKINLKIKRALLDNLQPTLCIGETIQQRNSGETEAILEQQIQECLEGVALDDVKKIVLAYEPIWAIGTGKIAKPDDVQKTHHFCRELIAKKWNKEIADHLTIQYGGSVHPDNAADLLKQEDIDGLLIGGASLSVESFVKIIKLTINKLVNIHK